LTVYIGIEVGSSDISSNQTCILYNFHGLLFCMLILDY
jgi:hypothetical protein